MESTNKKAFDEIRHIITELKLNGSYKNEMLADVVIWEQYQ